jgi:hypothetical protein
MIRFVVAVSCLQIICVSALALEPPAIWRDPDTGCAYLVTPQGGVSPRLRRDGAVDCPDARASSRFVDDAMRGLSQGLETLQRELEGLRDRLRSQSPAERLEDKT